MGRAGKFFYENAFKLAGYFEGQDARAELNRSKFIIFNGGKQLETSTQSLNEEEEKLKVDVFENAKIKFIKEHTRFKNGYYEYRVTKNGLTTSKSAKNFEDLVQKVLHPKRGVRKPQSLFFTDYIKTYMNLYRNGRYAASTVEEYKNIIKQISSAFINRKIDGITTTDLQNFINNITATRIREKILSFLKKVFKKAFDTGIIKKDVCAAVELPYIKKIKNRLSLTFKEQEALLTALEKYDEDFKKFVMFSLVVGTRREETCAFKLNDITGNKLLIHGTKTENAERTVVLSRDFIEFLKSGYDKKSNEPFFNLKADAYYHKLKRLYKRLNFPNALNLHSLRHTCSANLHYLGVPDKRRQQILGHSSIVITNNIYTELEADITSKNIKNLYKSYYFSDFN